MAFSNLACILHICWFTVFLTLPALPELAGQTTPTATEFTTICYRDCQVLVQPTFPQLQDPIRLILSGTASDACVP